MVTRVVVNVKEGAREKKEHSGLEAWIVPESCQTPKKRPEKGIMTRPDSVFPGRLPRGLLCFDIAFMLLTVLQTIDGPCVHLNCLP